MCTCIYISDRVSTCTLWYIHTYIYIRVGSVCAYELGKGYVLRVGTHTIWSIDPKQLWKSCENMIGGSQ